MFTRLIGALAIAGIAGTFALQGPPAQAHGLERIEATQVLNMLRSKGARNLELKTDSHGDPLITGEHEGTNFSTLFYNCENSRCKAFQFRASFTNEALRDRNHKLDLMNQYNSSWQFGKAYVSNRGSLIFEVSGSAVGGIELQNVDTYAQLFFSSIEEFKRIAGWR